MTQRTESERRAELVLLDQRAPGDALNAFDTSALALTDMEQPNIAYGRRYVVLELASTMFRAPSAVPSAVSARMAVDVRPPATMASVLTAFESGVVHRKADDEIDDQPPVGDLGDGDDDSLPRRPVTAPKSFGVREVVGWVDVAATETPPPAVRAPALMIVERYRLTTYARGFGLGDHLYSFTLFPEEEVEIEIKTWKTTEESAKAASSIFDGQSDQAESEFARAVEQENTSNRRAESAHEAHVEASAEAGWGWGSASITAGGSTSASQATEQFARNMSNATQKVANKATRERRIEITQSNETRSVEGEETHTTRKIKNINKCRTLNYNYFQLLRKYETRLELYDLRLLYASGLPYRDGTGAWTYEAEEVPLVEARRLLARVLVDDAQVVGLDAIFRHAGPGTDDEPGLNVLAANARPARPALDLVPLSTEIAWEDAARAAASSGAVLPPRPVSRLPTLLARDARVVATNAVYVEAMLEHRPVRNERDHAALRSSCR